MMYPHIRAHEQLFYGKRRKKNRPKKFPVRFGKENEDRFVPLSDYPINFFMPLLDPPGILLGNPIGSSLPDLTQPGRMWHGAVDDAAQRADRLRKANNGSDVTVIHAFMFLDFLKLLAKIAHSYAVASFGLDVIRESLLTDMIRAPKDAITDGAAYLIGGTYKDGKIRVETMWKGKDAYVLALLPIEFDNLTRRLLAAQIQLFAHAGAPVYQVVVCREWSGPFSRALECLV